MATPPTFQSEYEVPDWSLSTTPRTVTPTTAAGDLLVVAAVTADQLTQLTSPPTGNSLTYTLAQSITVASSCQVYGWTATDATGGTGWTLSVSETGTGAPPWGFNALRFSGSDGFGASAKTGPTAGAASLNITTTQDNSAVVVMIGDWAAVDGASRTWLTVNGTAPSAANGFEKTYFRDTVNYGVYIAYYPDVGTAGTKTVGLSAPTGQTYSMVAIEVKGAAGAATGGTPSPAQPGRTWLRRFRKRQIQPSVQAAAAPVTTQDLPPQPPRDRLFWFSRPRPRTVQPPPPPAVVVTTQALPPQPARDRLFPLLRRRPVATQVVVTVRPPVAQPPRDRLFPIPRRRGYVATPLPPVVTVTTQALPPQPVRRLTVPVSRRRGRTSAPVPPQVVIVTGPQALPPQPGRRRWGFLPRSRPRQAQPVPAQVVIVTGPQALPPQPQRDRIVPLPRRRQISTQPLRVTVQVTTQALPPQPFRDRLVPLPFRRGRGRNVVPPQVVVVTTQDLPRQPGRRRLRFLPRPRRGFATQLFRVYVVNPNDGVPVDNPGLVLTSPVAAMTVTSPIPGLTITRSDTAITLTVPAARLEIVLATFFTGDTSPDLTGTCTSNGVAAVITGATLALHLKKPDGTIVTKAGTIVSGPAGTWSYSWAPGDLDQTGTWWVEVQVTYSGGKIQTFGPSSFAVVEQFA